MNEEELTGLPSDDVPKREPDYRCNGKKVDKQEDGPPLFRGYCRNRAGKGTDHVGDGRCDRHGGSVLKGEEHPNFEHGLFSDHLSEDDRDEMEVIDARGNLANLKAMINYEFLRLRRAVRYLEEEDEEEEYGSFWEGFDAIVRSASASGLGKEEIASLAELLDSNYSAFNDRVEELRKLVKTYEELTEGKKVNIDGDMSHTHAGEEGGAPISIEWRESEAENQQSEEPEEESDG